MLRPLLATVGLILAVAAVPSADASQPTWTSHGPYGTSVGPLAAQTGVLYASDGRRIFASIDGAKSWSRMSDLPIIDSVLSLAPDPGAPASSVYAGTSSNGLFRTSDGGRSWISLPSPTSPTIPNPPSVSEVAVDPSNPSILYEIAYTSLVKSVDGGMTWALARSNVFSFALDPQDSAVLYAADKVQSDLLRSPDGGKTWRPLGVPPGYPGSPVATIAVDPQDTAVLYAARYYGLFKSVDTGANWVQLPLNSSGFLSLAVDAGDSRIAYASSAEGLFVTRDGGLTWSAVGHQLVDPRGLAVVADPGVPGTAYAGWPDGVFKTVDGGGTWADANSGIPSRVTALEVDPFSPASVFAVTTVPNGLRWSIDDGASWMDSSQGTQGNVQSIAFDRSTPSVLYAAGFGVVFGSRDGGSHWNKIAQLPESGPMKALLVDPVAPSVLLAGSPENPGPGISRENGDLLRSTDHGQNWALSIGGHSSILCLAADPSGVLYAGTGMGLFRSADTGITWIQTSLTPAATVVRSDPRVLTTVYAGSDQGVWKSLNQGASWTLLSADLAETRVTALAIDPVHPGTIYIGTPDSGILRSTDGGLTWSAFNDGLTNLDVTALAIDDSGMLLHAGTADGGVFDAVLSLRLTPILRGSRPTPIRLSPR
jgi:photosystem II stability/assembly factor-like uncharacterized protein